MSNIGAYAHISPGKLSEVVSNILQDYADDVYEATETGLDAAEKVMINRLKSASPKKSGKFSRNWKSTRKKYKLSRFVYNTTKVDGSKGTIPLSNILEYSTVRGNPFIKSTYEASADAITETIIAAIKQMK